MRVDTWEPPRVLPASWREMASPTNHGRAWQSNRGLFVLVSIDELEGTEFVHLSVSRKGRLPAWDELRAVKNLFIGRERQAMQVLPRESEWTSIHPYCLHLWSNLSQPDWLPDFTRGTGML